MSQFRSHILGVASYLPPRAVKNDELTKYMDTSDEWISTRSGIKERRWVEPGVSTSDLALEASKRVLEVTGTKKEEIDCIFLATTSPDHDTPGTACFLQAKLGVPGIPAIDIRQQCSGFIYGMAMADSFIRSGMYKKILLVGAEVQSTGLDLSDRGRDVSVLFGDGAGAMIIERADAAEKNLIMSAHLHADGEHARELWIEAPGTATGKTRVNPDDISAGKAFPKMNGKAVFINASRRMPEAIIEALEFNKTPIEAVDLFMFHQANLRINEMVAKQLKIPEEKVFNTIQKFGNTTAATIPIGLAEAVKEGKLKKGMLVASAAFGSGFTWASALYRW